MLFDNFWLDQEWKDCLHKTGRSKVVERVHGWMDGWMDVNGIVWIAHSNQKFRFRNIINFLKKTIQNK
jgi:hypothetical protein